MTKQCDNFAEELLSSGVPLTPEAAEHLRECGKCRKMRRTLLDTIPPEVPDFLKSGIMAAAEKEIARRKFSRLFLRAAVPFAAAVLIVIGIAVTGYPPANRAAVPSAVQNGYDWADMDEMCYAIETELNTCQYALANL